MEFTALELMFIFDAVANFSAKFCGDDGALADAYAAQIGAAIEKEMERRGFRWESPVA